MTSRWASAGRLAGILGLVLLSTTPLTWWLSGTAGPFVWGKLLLSAAAVAFFFSTHTGVLSGLFSQRTRTHGLVALSSVGLAWVLSVVLNILAWQNPIELDVTRGALHTLSEQTIAALHGLDTSVTAYAFFESSDSNYDRVEAALARYARESSNFRFELVSPEARPDLVTRFGIIEAGPRIVLVAGDRKAMADDVGEQSLTNALIRVSDPITRTIAFLSGHGELDFDDAQSAEGAAQIRQRLESEGFGTQSVSLFDAPAARIGDRADDGPAPPIRVPPSTSVVIVAGPRAPLANPELLALEEFVLRGGRLMLMIEPNSTTGLEAFVRPFKVDVRDDFVVDTNPMNRRLGLGAASPQIFATSEAHPITDSMVAPAIFVTVRSLAVLAGGQLGVHTRTLLRAGESAWGETDYASGAAGFDEADHAPPVHVAVLASSDTTSVPNALAPEGHLLVFGDSDFINNRNHTLQSNTDLFINAVNFLADEGQRIAVRPKQRSTSSISLTNRQMAGLRVVTMDLFPALLVALGFGVVTLRRRR